MSDQKTIHIEKIENPTGAPIEITLRQGEVKTPNLFERKGKDFNSTIDGPYQIFEKRKETFTEPILLVSKKEGYIRLIDKSFVDELRSEFTGVLKANPIFAELGINTDKRYSNGKDLTKKLRQVIHLFDDPSKFAELMLLESKLKGKISGEVDYADNKRGRVHAKNEFNFDAEGVATNFVLRAPIYIGGEWTDITINLYFDPRPDGVSFYLESTELIQKLAEGIDLAVDGEIMLFESLDPELPILEQV